MFEHDHTFRTEIRATRNNETVTLIVDTVTADIAIDVATANGTINGTALAVGVTETAELAAGLLAARSTATNIDGIGAAGSDNSGATAATGSERAALHTLATFIAGADHVTIGDDLVS